LRKCSREEFASLRFVLVGAEKLREQTTCEFQEKFGLGLLEGYGCTEMAPVVSVNTADFHEGSEKQVGSKPGTAGHPLPGIAVKVVDAQTGAPLPPNAEGLLLVKGPNRMLGYLNNPELTNSVLCDGWYVTGDIASLDDEGFIRITDRLSRFSKIGGEMVPHIKVEEKLHELANATEQTFVVTGLPDEKKGERLVVLHTLPDAGLASCLEKLAPCDLPNLWKPRADQFFRVDHFPLLGTGKLDLRKVKELAEKFAAPAPG
jgi:acyl-[acyl-carrier-protein]-phospholipid O-acyltransferase/long-chain-fatty-acid--[acyl-carrier-protein] ligase